MGAIYRREIGAFFSSSIAYVFLAVFYVITGFFFAMDNLAAGSANLSSVFSTMFMICIFLVPILTMRLFSEEKKQKTEQGLLTALLIGVSIVFIYGVILSIFGTVAWMTLISNYLAILLVGGAFIAVGLFISSLTENQLGAAVGGIVCLLLFFLVDTLAARVSVPWLQELLYYLSFYSRYYEFTCGIFNLSSVLFFISTTVLFNFFTVRVFEKRRWS